VLPEFWLPQLQTTKETKSVVQKCCSTTTCGFGLCWLLHHYAMFWASS